MCPGQACRRAAKPEGATLDTSRLEDRSAPSGRWRARTCVLVAALALLPAFALAQDAAALRDAGVAAARAGRLDEGRRQLEAALAVAPGDQGVLADLVVVLSWAGRDREALARYAELGEAGAPAYATAAAAVAARRSGAAAQAARLYRAAIAGGETGIETRLGLALAEALRGDGVAARGALADATRADPGNARIAEVTRDVERLLPPDPDVARARVREAASRGGPAGAVAAARDAAAGAGPATVVALADALMDLGRPFDALALIEAALARAPRHLALQRRQVLALATIGAPQLALDRAAAQPGTISAAEERRLHGAADAFRVRWGAQIDPPAPRDTDSRFMRTDAAIASLDAAIAAWSVQGPDAAGAIRAARIDRMIALRDRARMTDVLAEAAALREEGELPAYAREAVGDALLQQRRPEEAEAEYRVALAAQPGALEPALGLFYALTDQRRWLEARAVSDALIRDIPAARPVRGAGTPEDEWDRLSAVTSGILWRIWTDDLAGAEAEVDPLLAAAPMNAGLRALRGDVWRGRGWPARALEEYEIALTNAPDDLDLRLGHAEALLDRRRYAEARAEVDRLAAEYPDNAAVRRLARRQALRDLRELEATVRGGLDRGSSKPELDVAARLYTAPIDEAWRAFGGALLRTGDTSGGRLTAYRTFGGVEWRSPAIVATAGVTIDQEGVNRPGGFLDATLRLSDHWAIDAAGELTAVDTPLAALRAGIHADAARIGAAWRSSDLREAAAYARVMRFSDDNTRLIGFARWQERVLNLPDWKLDVQPYVYAASNSRQDVPYFSPEAETELAATAALTWIAWRRYESDLRVRLIATGGGYWQQGFGWSPLVAVRWENEHALGDSLSLAYGAGWLRRDYDGRAVDSASVTGALRWRF